jgi:hypothetical protein
MARVITTSLVSPAFISTLFLLLGSHCCGLICFFVPRYCPEFVARNFALVLKSASSPLSYRLRMVSGLATVSFEDI